MCRHLKLTLIIAGVLGLAGAAVAVSSLPGGPSSLAAAPPPISLGEHAETIAAMRPPKRARPVVAILGHNDGTETTDFLIPYGVLAEAKVADVVAVAPRAGRIQLKPALAVQAQATLEQFDQRFGDGADYVVVAAMHPRNDPQVLAWIQAQQGKGAVIVGICSGVRTLSAAGLLANRAATRYWYDADDLEPANPTTTWVRDRRYVVDRGVVTTTGITASMPISIALVEAIAGRKKAAEVAGRFGVTSWDERHDSDAFAFDRPMLAAALGNKAAVWNHESVAIPVDPGVDEVALAFTADAWSRTFRSEAVSVSARRGALETRRGLKLIPDRQGARALDEADQVLPLSRIAKPGEALPDALRAIGDRYGDSTASFVATQLEYMWRTGSGVATGRIPAGHRVK